MGEGITGTTDLTGDLQQAEMKHRFANCFQILEILVRFQRDSTHSAEARRHLERVLDLVRSVGMLQRGFDEQGRVPLADHLRDLGSMWSDMMADTPISIRTETDDVDALESTVTALSLITQELITNALEHGFFDDDAGTITIRLERGTDGTGLLSVIDDGRGFEADPDTENTAISEGLSLIAGLSRRLGGKFHIESGPNDRGTAACVTFPAEPKR